MALRSSSSKLLKSMADGLRGGSYFSTSTNPKMQGSPSTMGLAQHNGIRSRMMIKKGDIVAMGMAMGMIMLSTSFGIYTAAKELRNAPNVYVRKSRRETLPEVVEPEHVLEEADKFVKKSFFRRIAHLRDKSSPHQPAGMDIFSRPPKAETLRDIGVDPINH